MAFAGYNYTWWDMAYVNNNTDEDGLCTMVTNKGQATELHVARKRRE